MDTLTKYFNNFLIFSGKPCEGDECMVLGAVVGVVFLVVIAVKVYLIVRYCRKKKKSKQAAPMLVSEYHGKGDSKEKPPS